MKYLRLGEFKKILAELDDNLPILVRDYHDGDSFGVCKESIMVTNRVMFGIDEEAAEEFKNETKFLIIAESF
jgi:hypothetical protein